MASPVTTATLTFLPAGYFTAVKNRVDVRELPKEKLLAFKSMNVFEQQVLLHDLFITGMKMETLADREMCQMAAGLFVKAAKETRDDFFMHLIAAQSVFKIFVSSIVANCMYHSSEESTKKGASGLTDSELQIEKDLATKLLRKSIKAF